MKNQSVKQDINFLDKPLWLQKRSNKELPVVWKDIEGYIYRAGYKTPDHMDFLFLLYLLSKSERDNYKSVIALRRYEVIKACGYSPGEIYYERLEDSLKRWSTIQLEFHGTFYDGVKYKTISFGIIDAYSIREEDNLLEIRFSPEWLLYIQKSNFYKRINFGFYKALKRPVSRRLFEILCKSFHGRHSWEIGVVKLGHKLTLSPRKVIVAGVEKEVMYPSTVLIAIKPAVNEINKNALNPNLLKEAGLSPQDAFTVTYTVKNGSEENKVIEFKKIPVSKVCPELSRRMSLPVASKQVDSDEPGQEEESEWPELFDLLKSSTKHLKDIINRYCREKGIEYVRWNILYANGNATKNYVAYLKQSLEEDWAVQLREEHQAEQAKQKAKQELDAKIASKVEEARRSEYIILPTGERYKIQTVTPSNTVFMEQNGNICGIVMPEQILKCQFE